ncbi:MAG: site-2 protease family protein [Clostridium sp.]|uniref:site-2 protease family protein n=1 Tax=Clostridium sp. TaxID=1506 RepID=UPI00301E7E7C
MNDYILGKILSIPAILVAFTFKGYVQARIAMKLGDDTPRQYERNTLNPLKHIDMIGFIFMILIGFGWIKPVEINKSNFKDYYKDDLKVRVGGIVTTLGIAVISTIILVVYLKYVSANEVTYIIHMIILNIALLNYTWFMLNLLPIPGFDGFQIITNLLRGKGEKFQSIMYKNNMFIFIILVLPLIGNKSILDIIVGIPGIMIFNVVFGAVSTIL